MAAVAAPAATAAEADAAAKPRAADADADANANANANANTNADANANAADAAPVPPAHADRASFAYTAYYCEENAYLLVKRLVEEGTEAWAVFVANRERFVPIWRQRAARDPASPTCWDYHVFAVARATSAPEAHQRPSYCVYDLDTTIEPFPAAFDEYRRQALRPVALAATAALPPPRRYRVVPAADLLTHFASDRSHMRTADGRGWTSPPPPWPPIAAPEGGGDGSNTLPLFLDMRRAGEDSAAPSPSWAGEGGGEGPSWAGRVMSEDEFFAFFGAQAPPPPLSF